MSKKCINVGGMDICSGPRANWWLDSIGVNWYSGGGGSEPFVPSARLQAVIARANTEGFSVPPDSFLSQLDNLFLIPCEDILASRYLRFYAMLTPVGYSDFARIDYVDPANNPLLTLTALVGSWDGSHSALGFTNGGDGDSYIDTNFNPSTDGGLLYSINSASYTCDASSYNTSTTGNIFAIRAATAQITMNPKASSDGRSKCIIHDNTNMDFTNTGEDRGLYIIRRTASNAKRMFRRGGTQTATTASIAIPNGTITLLARRRVDTATIDNFYPGIISNWGVGAPLTDAEEIEMRNAWVNFKLTYQSPLLTVSDIEGTKVVFTTGAEVSWDDGSVFGMGRYLNTMYYGGTDEAGGDPTGYSIGAFDLSGQYTGTKNVGNPIFNVSGISPNVSIMPMDVYERSGTLYMLASVRTNESPAVQFTAILTASTSDRYSWTYIGALFDAGAGPGEFNHGATWFEDPNDPTYIKVAYAFRADNTVQMRINIARCLLSNDITVAGNWSIQHSNILTPSVSAASIVYPKLYWTGTDYLILYGRFFPEAFDDGFSCFASRSSDLSSFPAGLEFLWPTGVSGDPDSGYTSIPRLDQANGLIFYGARQGGGSTPYTSVCVKSYTENL